MGKSWDLKISTSKFVIISLMVSAVGFFAIPRTSSIIYSSDLINVSVLVVSVFSLFFSSGHVLSNKYLKSYQNWMLFTIALWIALVTYSTINYHRNKLSQVWSDANPSLISRIWVLDFWNAISFSLLSRTLKRSRLFKESHSKCIINRCDPIYCSSISV